MRDFRQTPNRAWRNEHSHRMKRTARNRSADVFDLADDTRSRMISDSLRFVSCARVTCADRVITSVFRSQDGVGPPAPLCQYNARSTADIGDHPPAAQHRSPRIDAPPSLLGQESVGIVFLDVIGALLEPTELEHKLLSGFPFAFAAITDAVSLRVRRVKQTRRRL